MSHLERTKPGDLPPLPNQARVGRYAYAPGKAHPRASWWRRVIRSVWTWL